MSTFRNVRGNTRAVLHLKRAVLADRISHAYLITGDSGSGKETLAMAFATTLQCTELPGRIRQGISADKVDACGTCINCRKAADRNLPDLKVWHHEKPKTFSVEDVRSLVTDVQIRPYECSRKIYILPGAHLMTAEAQNALLKTLEEPPAYAVFVLLADTADAMLETIRSRCVEIDLETVSAVSDEEISQFAIPLLSGIREYSLADITAILPELSERKASADALLDQFTAWYRDVLYFKATMDADGLLHADSIREIRRASSEYSYQGLRAILDAIQTARLRLLSNVNFDLTMELLLLTMAEK